MQEPLVTIVTPSYNQGQFIRETIESVLSQNYPHVEYIIMDGGSTDETASVVSDYASRLTFISEKDRGQSHAINKGFKMAKGSILSWLNSDDLYLPGAIQSAVKCFELNSQVGAVYGEGYLIDRAGHISCRFPYTEAFNLWKLVYLSDYILQQSVYFKKHVLEEVGYLNESLHYTMDWDILIRIGKKYQIELIPEYMGCLREYPEAKSSIGGVGRVREIQQMLYGHTGRMTSPGYVVYGLDTYHKLWCDWIDQVFGCRLKPIAERLKAAVKFGAGTIINRTIAHSQGLYSDGWAGRYLHYLLPPGTGSVVIEGSVPDWHSLQGQRLYVDGNGVSLGGWDVPVGDFRLTIPVPRRMASEALHLRIEAAKWIVPAGFRRAGDRRRLAYRFKNIKWKQTDWNRNGSLRSL